jgi:hypothetical protein
MAPQYQYQSLTANYKVNFSMHEFGCQRESAYTIASKLFNALLNEYPEAHNILDPKHPVFKEFSCANFY